LKTQKIRLNSKQLLPTTSCGLLGEIVGFFAFFANGYLQIAAFFAICFVKLNSFAVFASDFFYELIKRHSRGFGSVTVTD